MTGGAFPEHPEQKRSKKRRIDKRKDELQDIHNVIESGHEIGNCHRKSYAKECGQLADDETLDDFQRAEQHRRILDATLSSITDFAYTFDREGRFLYANQPLLDLWGLTLDEAHRAFRVARALPDADEGLARVIAEKRGALRRNACLELIDADVTLDDVGGLEVLKAWLRSRVLAFDAGARTFGLAEPRGMLVCGVQGCGKSLVSKATARVLSLPLVRLDFAEVFAAGSPEHAIHEATRAVEAVAPVVLWVDEIEKGLGADANDARQVRVFGAFLTWLQERRAPVFVAATANDVERLPPELARRGRFDEVFFVDLPSTKERAQILGVHLSRRGRDPGEP